MSEVVDYTTFTHINSTPEERLKLGVGDIYMNVFVHDVPECMWVIRSRNAHDFVTCRCGNLSVDGGSFYTRLVGDVQNARNESVMYNYLHKDEDDE